MVKYPELAKLMAVEGMSRKALAKIIGKAPSAITEKLEGKTDFKLSETKAITQYFKKVNPEITGDFIFTEVVTIVNN